LSRSDGPVPGWPSWPGAAGDEPAFHTPWQAKAFALAVHLHEAGLFTWDEWAGELGARLAAAADMPQDSPEAVAEGYFTAWLAALEAMASARGAAGAEEIAELAALWQAAARATPHGQPIVLEAASASPGPAEAGE